MHAHTYPQQGTRSRCSHRQDVSALDSTVPSSPSLAYRVGFFPCYFVSECQHWLWWLIDLAGAAGFKTTTLAAAAQGNRERAGWVNPRREETTLVICQLWESYNKLGITIFIVLRWRMQAEPGRSILTPLRCAPARGLKAKAVFPSRWAAPHTPHLTSFSTWAHKNIPCLWGKGALYLSVTTTKLYYYSPTLKRKKCSSHKASPPLQQPCPFPLGPPTSQRIKETLSLCSCSSHLLTAQLLKCCTDSCPEVIFPLVKKTEKTTLDIFDFVTFPHNSIISCDLLSPFLLHLLTPVLLPLH